MENKHDCFVIMGISPWLACGSIFLLVIGEIYNSMQRPIINLQTLLNMCEMHN